MVDTKALLNDFCRSQFYHCAMVIICALYPPLVDKAIFSVSGSCFQTLSEYLIRRSALLSQAKWP
ncbi:MAG: hypothetical protein WD572_02270 [Gammaproteobacteria bacterium]